MHLNILLVSICIQQGTWTTVITEIQHSLIPEIKKKKVENEIGNLLQSASVITWKALRIFWFVLLF